MQKLTDILGRKCQVPGAKCQGILHGRFNNVLRAIGCIVVTSLMLLSLTGCINETFPEDPVPAKPVEQFNANCYLQLHVNLPSESGTRSTTQDGGGSSSGIDKGESNESKVEKAYLFFFQASSTTDLTENTLVCSFEADKTTVKNKNISSTDAGYDIYAKLEKEHLLAMAGKEMHLYVIANMDFGNYYKPANEDVLLNGSFTERNIGTYTKPFPFGNERAGEILPLSNQQYYVVDLTKIVLPEGEEDDAGQNKLLSIFKKLFTEEYEEGDDKGILWKAYSTSTISDDKGKELYTGKGTLSLERMVARIDYAPKVDGNKIDVFQLQNAKDNNNQAVYLKVVSMQLFNLGTEAYYFRHTAPDGSNVQPFGVEKRESGSSATTYNWIADSDWEDKKAGTRYTFFNQMTSTTGPDANGNSTTMWSFTGTYAYITSAQMQKLPTAKEAPTYHPWYYVMENTVNTTDKMNLQYSTGIEFRMVVCDANGNPVQKVADNAAPYRITMQTGAADNKVNWYKEPKWIDANKDDEPDGYYLTYRYLIDHNNNEAGSPGNSSSVNPDTGAATDKAPMQYAIVRNNIYRISVSGITRLPDPHEPDNPWMSVEIKVLPWVKRTIEVNW